MVGEGRYDTPHLSIQSARPRFHPTCIIITILANSGENITLNKTRQDDIMI